MADSPLIIKSKEFALQIIKVCNYVNRPKKKLYLQINLSVAVQVLVRISVRLFTVMVQPILLPNFKFHSKNVQKVNIGWNF